MTATVTQPRTTTTLRRTTPSRPVTAPRRSVALALVMLVLVLYTLMPLAYLIINATKTSDDFFRTFGLGFGTHFNLWHNLRAVFTYHGGVYGRWFANTVLYVVAGAGGATALATAAGYAIAKMNFPGRRSVLAVVLVAIAVPGTAIALPTFLLFSALNLTDTPWAVILPSLISPFGLYLMWTYAAEAVPTELLEAARIDGASELRTFLSIALRLLAPGVVTVLLFSVATTWNNYLLPLIMLSNPRWYPLTVGLSQWNAQVTGTDPQPIQTLVITGSLVAIIPIVAVFLLLQRYWQSGLAAGSVKQ